MTDFRKEFRIFFATVLIVCAALIAAVIFFKLDSIHKDQQIRAQAKQARIAAHRAEKESQRTTRSLCSLRENLHDRAADDQKKLEQTRRFLAKNPHGAFGFSRAQIAQTIRDDQTSLDNLKSTVRSLSTLQCDAFLARLRT